jgi:hypothetical protein
MLDEATIQNLKAAHGEVHLLSAHIDEDGDGANVAQVDIVARRPTRAVFARMMGGANDKDTAKTFRALLRDVVVWPEQAEIDETLERWPGLLIPFANKVLALGAASAEVTQKKL